nr:hypothetical protein [Tanacetum cinerariifolium]
MGEPSSLDRYASNPNNNNELIEADVLLLGELGVEVDDPMVNLVIDKLAEPIVEAEELVIAPVTDVEEDIAMLFGDDDFSDDNSKGFEDEEEDLSTRMGNLEYGHGRLVKKVIQVSDAEVANGIAIREISTRFSDVEGQVQVMASQMVQAVGRLKQVGTQVEQGQQVATQREEVIFELSQ